MKSCVCRCVGYHDDDDYVGDDDCDDDDDDCDDDDDDYDGDIGVYDVLNGNYDADDQRTTPFPMDDPKDWPPDVNLAQIPDFDDWDVDGLFG